MPFKRPGVRYARTPEPSTPYQAAQQHWDEAIGGARVQAANWRYLAFAMVGLTAVLVAGLLWQMTRSVVIPYIVEVDAQGAVHNVAPVNEMHRLTDAEIVHHLTKFLHNVRSLPLDPIVLRDQWLESYEFTTARGAKLLNEFARIRDPFSQVGRVSITVDVSSVVRASENSFQIRWVERTYVNGALNSTESWTGIFSIILQPPKDAARLMANPLGIYIDGLDWSREMGADTKSGENK